jgi:hypothetical protein
MAREFRENFVGVLTLVIVSLAIYGLVRVSSRSATANSTNIAATETSDIPDSDHYLYAPIYSTKGGLSSRLGLNNSQNHPITARVTLYNKHGHSLTTPEMEITLGSHRNHGFNIADWIGNLEGFDEGSVAVFFHGPSMALGSQEIITDAEHSLNFDVHLKESHDFMSSRVEGLWWNLDNQTDAEVFIANTRATLTTVTPTFYVGGAAYQGEVIALDGHESEAIDIKQSLNRLHVSGNTTVGGISLTYTNGPGAIVAVGMIANKHQGFATTMRFIDPASQQTRTLHGANLPIGKPAVDSGFPSGTRFTPHVIVRNNTNQAVEVKPRIRYTLNDQAQTINLGTLTVFAREVRELDLSEAINTIGNHRISDAGVEIKHNGQPGTVMAYAASIDQSDSAVFDVPIKDPASEMGFKGGSYPWNIDGDNRAVLHVKNIDLPGDGQKHEFVAKLYFDGGEYNLPLQQMDAGQTAEVDLKKVRDDQVPDVLGNVIPLTVTGGQLAWYGRANKGEFIGRLVEYNPVAGVSSSFSCVQPCHCHAGYISSFVVPVSYDGTVGDSFNVLAFQTDADCNGAHEFTHLVPNASFFSTNSSVVSVSGNTANLVGAGNADIIAAWDVSPSSEDCGPLPGEFIGPHCFCSYPSVTAGGDTAVSAAPRVSKIQYQSGSNYVDISGTLYVLKGATVTFKAVPSPPATTWPSGRPLWGGTSGASGTGETKAATFNAVSSSTSDFKTVTATSGNTVTVNVIVFDLTGVLTPDDNFSGRSLVRFGIQELISLSFTPTPTGITASQVGGLQWELSGVGTLRDAGPNGTAAYEAPQTAGAATLTLKVQGGPSQGGGPSQNITIVAPSGGGEFKEPGTFLRHIHDTWSVGFQGVIYVTPTDVSFRNLFFIEKEVGATGTGWLSFLNGAGHFPNLFASPLAHCNIDHGCEAQDPDQSFTGAFGSPGNFGVGDVNWPIPWNYITAGGTRVQFTTVSQHGTSSSTGRATIEKGGSGTFSREASDPTSNYGG